MNDKLKKLHQLLVSKGIDNKSYDEFYSNFSSSPEKQQKLHNLLVQKGIDNKSFNEFQSNFFGQVQESEQPKEEIPIGVSAPVKKKEFSELGSQETQPDVELSSKQIVLPTSSELSKKQDQQTNIERQEFYDALKNISLTDEESLELENKAKERINAYKNVDDSKYSGFKYYAGQSFDYISLTELVGDGFTGTQTKEQEFADVIEAYEQAEQVLSKKNISKESTEYKNQLDSAAQKYLSNLYVAEKKDVKAKDLFEDMDDEKQERLLDFGTKEYLKKDKDLRKEVFIYENEVKQFNREKQTLDSQIKEFNALYEKQKKVVEDLEQNKNKYTEEQLQELQSQYDNRVERLKELSPKILNESERLEQKRQSLNEVDFTGQLDDKLDLEDFIDLAKREYNWSENLGKNVLQGFGNAYESIVGLVQLSTETQEKVLGALSPEGSKFEFLAKNGVLSQPIKEHLETLIEGRNLRNEMYMKPMKPSDVNSVEDFLYLAGQSLADQTANLTIAIASGGTAQGAAIFGIQGAGGKQVQITEQEKFAREQGLTIEKPSQLQKLSSALIAGAAESLFFHVGTGKNLKVAENVLNRGRDVVKKNVLKEGIKGAVRETFEEVNVEVIDGINNYIVLQDDDAMKTMKENMPNVVFSSAVVGGLTTSTPHTVGFMANMYSKAENKRKLSKNLKEIQDLSDMLANTELTDDIKADVKKRIKEITDESYGVVEKTLLDFNLLTDTEKKTIAENYQKQKNLKEKAKKVKESANLDDEKKKLLLYNYKKEAERLNIQKEDILTEAQKRKEQPKKDTNVIQEQEIDSKELQDLQKEIEAEERKVNEKRKQQELEEKRKVSREEKSKRESQVTPDLAEDKTTKLDNFIGVEMVDTDGNVGVVQERGNSGQLQWVSENKIIELGEIDSSTQIFDSLGLSVKPEQAKTPINLTQENNQKVKKEFDNLTEEEFERQVEESEKNVKLIEDSLLEEAKTDEDLEAAEQMVDEFKKQEQDRLEKLLDKIIESTSNKGRAFDATLGLPLFVINSTAKIIKATYKSGKSLAQAIQAGYNHAKKYNPNLNELDFKKYYVNVLSGKQKLPTDKKLKDKQKETKKHIRTQGGKKFSADENLKVAMEVNPELLTEEQANEYEELLDDIKSPQFSQTQNANRIKKFADIKRNEPKEEKPKTETKQKEKLDDSKVQDLSNTQKQLKNKSVKNVNEADVDLVKDFMSMTEEDFSNLSEKEYDRLITEINDVFNGGKLNQTSRTAIRRVVQDRKAREAVKDVKGRKFRILRRDWFSKFLGGEYKDTYRNLRRIIERESLGNISNIFKGKKDDKILDNTYVSDVASAYDKMEVENTQGILKTVNKILFGSNKLVNELKKKGHKDFTQAFVGARIYFINLQEMYNANPNTKGVFKPKDHLEANQKLVASSTDMGARKEFVDLTREAEKAYESLPKNEDGSIDIEKAKAELTNGEKKIYDSYRDYLDNEGRQRTIAIGAEKGEAPLLYNSYIPLATYRPMSTDLTDALKQSEQVYADGLNTPELKSLFERQNKANPLNFDLISVMNSHVRSINREYNMRPALTNMSEVFKRVYGQRPNFESDLSFEEKQFFRALEDQIKSTVQQAFFYDNYTENNEVIKFAERLREIGYNVQLASLVRASVEGVSNLVHAEMFDPKSMNLGIKTIISKNYNDEDFMWLFMNNGFNQTNRVFLSAESMHKELNFKTESQKAGNKFFKSSNAVVSLLKRGKRQSDRFANEVNKMAVAGGDRLVIKPFAIGSFLKELNRISDEKIDIKRLREDADYYNKHRDNIKKAIKFANTNTQQLGSSTNAFESVNFARLDKKDRGTLFKSYDKYMTRFTMSEHSSIVKGWDAMIGNRTDMTKGQGRALLVATFSRMLIYNMTYKRLAELMFTWGAGLFGYAYMFEDEDDEDLTTKAAQAVARDTINTMVSSLIFGRLGNWAKTGLSAPVEMLNVKYGHKIGLRSEKTYDPYRDSVLFNSIKLDPKSGALVMDNYNIVRSATQLTGAYSTLINGLVNTVTSKLGSDRSYRGLVQSILSIVRLPLPRDLKRLMYYEKVKEYKLKNPKKYQNFINDFPDMDFDDTNFEPIDFNDFDFD